MWIFTRNHWDMLFFLGGGGGIMIANNDNNHNNNIFLYVFMLWIMSILLININLLKEIFPNYDFLYLYLNI